MGTIDRARKVGVVIALAAALAGCAGQDPHACPAGLRAMIAAELYFGRSIPGGGEISDADWQRFADEEVTPRFPDGLTVTDAKGQWRDKTGIVREASKRLFVVISGTPAESERLEAIRTAYRTRFRQEAVLIVETPVCGGF